MDDIGGNIEKEEFVVADVVVITVDVGSINVDKCEETGSDKRVSNILWRLGYASVEGG